MHEVHLKISIANHLSKIPPPQQFHTQLNARLILQTNQDPIKLQASHVVEALGSDSHLLASNVEGVGSVPPPFN